MVRSGDVGVRHLQGHEWQTYRRLRLDALADAPDAFASTLEREQSLTEAAWRERLAGDSVTIAAMSGDDAVGIVTVLFHPHGEAGGGHIVGMWVDPSARGYGIGAQLVEAAVTAARASNRPDLTLWVVENNHAARRLYERSGFVVTGRTQPLPSNPALAELHMVLAPSGVPGG